MFCLSFIQLGIFLGKHLLCAVFPHNPVGERLYLLGIVFSESQCVAYSRYSINTYGWEEKREEWGEFMSLLSCMNVCL